MIIFTDNRQFQYELSLLAHTFSKNKDKFKIESIPEKKDIGFDLVQIKGEYLMIHQRADQPFIIEGSYHFQGNSTVPVLESYSSAKEQKNAYKRILYRLLSSLYKDSVHPWGILTGIRPVKIVHELFSRELKPLLIKQILSGEYFISDEKIQLSIDIAETQRKYFPFLDNSISIYINIPFCPSRCSYCSFFAMDISDKNALLISEQYLDALEKEMKHIFEQEYLKSQTISAIYIGGGTPSSLSALQIERLLRIVKKYILISEQAEYTFEAGRVDSLNEEKMKIIQAFGVTRISINPQTMNDDTLVRIGRKHTARDVEECFQLARKCRFDNINMDIILGLEDEDEHHIRNTLERISLLGPESLTVHTLAVKRASKLREHLDLSSKELNKRDIQRFMSLAHQSALSMNMHPYYLYRQKNMLLNLENTGYAIRDRDCLYNIGMMEERQTILAFGSGGISKFLYKNENRIERVGNIKDVRLYVQNIQEVIDKKDKECRQWINQSISKK